MKKLAKFVTLLVLAAVLFTLPGIGTMTAEAAEAKTYSISYVENVGWRWQEGAPFDTSDYHRDLYYLYTETIKDGDLVVIYPGAATAYAEFNFPVALSNLTLVGTANGVVVHAKSIDECFVLNNTTAAINGDVKKAYLYDRVIATFNNNVEYLELDPTTAVHNRLSCAGTVKHALCKDGDKVHFEVYDVAAGKFAVENSKITTAKEFYSTTPSAAAPEEPQAPSNDYDEVPKTGESALIFLLLGLTVVCFAGSHKLRRA